MREKEKLFKELDKTRKELEKKTEAEKKLAKYEQLYETLRNENEVSHYNLHLKLL